MSHDESIEVFPGGTGACCPGMVLKHAADYASQWAAIESIAAMIGCTAETLRRWVRQIERDVGVRLGLTTAEASGSSGGIGCSIGPRRA